MPEIKPYIVHESYIENHCIDGLRSGEGAVVSLPDGSLYMVYTHFEGQGDHDKAALVARRSNDGGLNWSEPETLLMAPENALNVMSVSLLVLSDGRLACMYLQKNSISDCRPFFITSAPSGQNIIVKTDGSSHTTDGTGGQAASGTLGKTETKAASKDDGLNWSNPAPVITNKDYYVVNNDRLVQLSRGRLLVPYARHPKLAEGDINPSWCGCAFSDDGGKTWQSGAEIAIEKENIQHPALIDSHNPGAVKIIEDSAVYPQEPGAVELLDGRVMMWCRSRGGFAYSALSDDGGQTWSPFKAITEFSMPNGPQSIKRLPGSNRLIMLYNDRGDMPFGSPQFHWRRPLSVAISDDDAKTWQRYGQLEPDDIPSNCYYSICFHNDNVIFTYYEGVMQTQRDGNFAPRNLASLKLKVVKLSYFQR